MHIIAHVRACAHTTPRRLVAGDSGPASGLRAEFRTGAPRRLASTGGAR
ncbi:hypothetical protein [Micromonospora sp. SH-82]